MGATTETPTAVQGLGREAQAGGSAWEGVEPRRRRRQGPVAAAYLGFAAGQFSMGLFTLIDQKVNPTEWIPPAGREAGLKMIFMWSNYAVMTGLFFQTIIAWLVVWAIAHEALHKRKLVSRRTWVIATVLLCVGLLCSFTPFYTRLIPG